ncbi:hypothetical protein P0L94_02710 [Microbacter sp. GSS18]|nr:hypothetical protein P0L94_02710 [Microbacter sp. GSS18]
MSVARSIRLVPSTVVLVLLSAMLSACVQPPAPTASASPPATASPAPTPEPEPAALEVSVDGVDLVDSAGDVVGQATFDDGAGMLSFLGDALGSTPAGVPNAQGYPITFYDWGDVSVSVIDDGPATVWIASATAGPLELRTTEGVEVGMTTADAIALGATEDSALPDSLIVQVREAPGTESLMRPGTTGVDFILLVIEGDAVARMISPANDWGDL